MATRASKEAGSKTNPGDEFADSVKESAQQIWLAGLGAFAKAQEQGGKVFESLVKEGLEMQRKTQSAAEEKWAEVGSRAAGQWDKLENIFDERVLRTLHRLGAPTADDIAMLAARIDELERRIGRPGPAPTPKRPAKPTAKKSA